MRELLHKIEEWQKEDKQIAIATVIDTYGSAPRGLGAKMAVSQDCEIVGSVSGGCIEGAVVRECLQVIKSGQPKSIRYGVSNDEALEVGLSCGGEIEVYLEKYPPRQQPNALVFELIQQFIQEDTFCASATYLAGEKMGRKFFFDQHGECSNADLNENFNKLLKEKFHQAKTEHKPQRFQIEPHEEQTELFLEIFPPRKKLVIIGAVHIAISLITYANELGYETIVLDARSAFATQERFPHAARIIVGWPGDELAKMKINESTAIVLLTHDPKMDVPALMAAVKTPAAYIGILGSKKTHQKRVLELRELFMSDANIARIHAPVGLKIGAKGPKEIALSVIAEIIAANNGKA